MADTQHCPAIHARKTPKSRLDSLSQMAGASGWQFFVDRGGTFTDCIGRDPATGVLSVVKVPSSDEAPLLGIRRLLGLAASAPIPACELRLGTTLGTNALLERKPSADGVVSGHCRRQTAVLAT